MNASFVLGLVVTLSAPGLKEPAKKDQLVGTWLAERATFGGEVQPGKKTIRYVFAADGTFATFADDRKMPGADQIYTLDPAKSPPTIDLTGGKSKVEGIYKVDGDTLTLCLAIGKGDRPTTFESTMGSFTVLMVFKRAKPKD